MWMIGLILLILSMAAPAIAADRIIVISTDTSIGGLTRHTVVFWLPVAVGKELPTVGASAFGGASDPEKEAIRLGQIVEELHTFTYAATDTPALIQARLQAAWTSRKAYKDGQPASGEHYGATMNDAGVWRKPH